MVYTEMKYQLGSTEVEIKVTNVDDNHLEVRDSHFMSAHHLKELVMALDGSTLFVTHTMPQVFLSLKSVDTTSRTYHMSYRAFLGFASALTFPEEDKQDWKKMGF